MNVMVEHDPYFIPTVPRYKKDLAKDDLDETIGDRFFELNFGDALSSPLQKTQNRMPLQQTKNTSAVRSMRSSIGPIPATTTTTAAAAKKENIPPRPFVPQSSMRLRSATLKKSEPNTDTAPQPPIVRPRRSRSLIKPGRPSIEFVTHKTQQPPNSPPKPEIAKPLATKSGSIFSTKPRELLAPSTTGPAASMRPRRSRSLIKPGRPSIECTGASATNNSQKAPVNATKSGANTPMTRQTVTTTVSRFAAKPKEPQSPMLSAIPTPSMAPFLAQAQAMQTDHDPNAAFPWWVRFVAKGFGIVGGFLAMFFGVLGLISISANGIVACLLQLAFGFLIVALEAPFCCAFVDFIERIAAFSESRAHWHKAALYCGMGILPLLFCIELNTILGSGLVFASGLAYGFMALGRKADKSTMMGVGTDHAWSPQVNQPTPGAPAGFNQP